MTINIKCSNNNPSVPFYSFIIKYLGQSKSIRSHQGQTLFKLKLIPLSKFAMHTLIIGDRPQLNNRGLSPIISIIHSHYSILPIQYIEKYNEYFSYIRLFRP